ncbi:MAG: NUDIX domain-containing protein, partial [Spirochaetes bacterium]|nr:NUDIX domain-containing protein [Spirochaetota bacterium]
MGKNEDSSLRYKINFSSGGKVEDNESVLQALLREIKEETGQDADEI